MVRRGKKNCNDLKFDALKKKKKQLVDNKNDHPKMENLIQYIEKIIVLF